jgi:branched-chain amino acid transport system substrate-binding protein
MKIFRQFLIVVSSILISLFSVFGTASADDHKGFKLGVVTFLSGPAAEPFGVPAWNGGKLFIDLLNAGKAPAPYNKVGFGGMKITAIPIDENGGATKQVQEFRNLVQRDNVDAVLGYVSSGDCMAIPSVADELQALTVLYDCGTPRVFEDASYKYVFRTAAHAAMDNIAIAKYLISKGYDVSSIAGINQNYAWGTDSWKDFSVSIKKLSPNSTVKNELFPKIFSGQYGTEISALMNSKAKVVHSSLWGGDLQSFILQAKPRGLFKRTQVVFSAGDHVMPGLGNKYPEGVIVGARGQYGMMAPDTALNRWFYKVYMDKYGVFPAQPPYRMVQGLMGLKMAIEKAMENNGGKKPNKDQIATAFTGLEWEAPGGLVQMKLGNGHQAIQPHAIGKTAKDKDGNITITDIVRYNATCVNPPNGIKATDWIKAGFPGAVCNK